MSRIGRIWGGGTRVIRGDTEKRLESNVRGSILPL
jgi:hypothetical protein